MAEYISDQYKSGGITSTQGKAAAYDAERQAQAVQAVQQAKQEIPKGVTQFKAENGMEYVVGKDGVPIPMEQVMYDVGLAGNSLNGGRYQMPAVQVGQSAGQIAAREGMSKAWNDEGDIVDAPWGAGWDPILGAGNTASYVLRDDGYKQDADNANKSAFTQLQNNAAIGRANAMKELVAYGYTPEQAMQLIAQTGR